MNVSSYRRGAGRSAASLCGCCLAAFDAGSAGARSDEVAAPTEAIVAAFADQSAPPRATVRLVVSTREPWYTLQLFRAGGEARSTHRNDVMHGVAVTRRVAVGWLAHVGRPATLRVRVGDWESGLYFAKLTAGSGRVGYAPIVVRPRRLGDVPVAVVLPTYTWQAYNFRDDDGDGTGNTWYACSRCTVRLGRAFLNRGVPPHFRRYDLPFLRWLARGRRHAEFLADGDLERLSGIELARAYALVVFPGHHEYVTRREYDAITGYRNSGGNLAFLSANNFFWWVDRDGRTLRRVAQWRDLGRPEAALIGVQYRANDRGRRKGAYVVRDTAAAPWLFKGTGLRNGSRFTGYGSSTGRFGIEIDATTRSSPRGTKVLAEIPNLFGRGVTAQMTYYETRAGAKVYAAGAFSIAGAALWHPVDRMLDNLWNRLAQP